MTFEHPGDGALDYMPCEYRDSKISFRGPAKALDDPYVAFLGGTETYGRFIELPFPELVEGELGMTGVNLGCVNAGIDVFLNDRTLMNIAADARVTVIQVMGAQNMSNRFYSVHPRRNDRFIGPSALLRTIYRDVDFTDFAFTRHLLQALEAHGMQRYSVVIEELKAAWVARMRLLLNRVESRKVLLWMSSHSPDDASPAADPLYVDRRMVEAILPEVDEYVEVVYSRAAQNAGTEGMIYSELEAPAVTGAPGVRAHWEVADALVPVLSRFLH